MERMSITNLRRAAVLVLTILITLGKGQERDYRIILFDVETELLDDKYVSASTNFLLAENEDNKTVIIGEVEFKEDFPATITIKWELRIKDENNAEKVKVSGKEVTLCSFMVDQKPMARMLTDNSNLPEKCPYKMGTYNVTGALPKEELFPQNLPKDIDTYKLRLILYIDSDPIFIFWANCRIEWKE